jgi:integrase
VAKPSRTLGRKSVKGHVQPEEPKTRERRPWGGSVFTRADRPGSLWIKWRDPVSGKRRQALGAGGTDDAAREQAERKLAEVTGRIAADVERGVRAVTARGFLAEYLPVFRTRVSAAHYENVASQLGGPEGDDGKRRGGFADWLGSLPLHAVGTDKIERFLASLQSGVDPVAPATVRRYAAALSGFFRAAVDANATRENPVRRARLPKAQQFEPHALTPADVDRILAQVPEHARAAFVLLADLGLRLGELLRLTWQHVLEDGSAVAVVGTKSGRTRTVFVPARSRELLAELRKMRPAPLRGSDVVVRRPRSKSRLQAIFREAAKAAGLPVAPDAEVGVRIHDLRHAYASALARNGIALSVVANLIGDSIAVTSSRYARHVPASEASRAVATLERRVSTPAPVPAGAAPPAAQSA